MLWPSLFILSIRLNTRIHSSNSRLVRAPSLKLRSANSILNIKGHVDSFEVSSTLNYVMISSLVSIVFDSYMESNTSTVLSGAYNVYTEIRSLRWNERIYKYIRSSFTLSFPVLKMILKYLKCLLVRLNIPVVSISLHRYPSIHPKLLTIVGVWNVSILVESSSIELR